MKVNKSITSKLNYRFFTALQFLCVLTFLGLAAFAQEIPTEGFDLIPGLKTEKIVAGQIEHDYFINLKRGQVLRFNFVERGANIRALIVKITDKPELMYAANSGKIPEQAIWISKI